MYEKNSEDIEKTKIIFQYILMLVASVIAGIYFSKLLSADSISELTAKVISHFGKREFDGSILSGGILEFIHLSVTDIVCILILFVFSFSFVNYIVSDIVLIFIGFRFGINSAILMITSVSTIGVGNSLLFLLLRGIMLPIFAIYACRISVYSLNLRRFSVSNARIMLNKKATLAMIGLTVIMLGTTIIFNGLYCLFIYIF